MEDSSHFLFAPAVKVYEERSGRWLESSSDGRYFYTNFGRADSTWTTLISAEWFEEAQKSGHPAGYRVEIR